MVKQDHFSNNAKSPHTQAREALQNNAWEEHEARRSMTQNEAMLAAMLENARNSSWRENLDNAVDAHEHFMLGSEGRDYPKMVAKIRERRDDLMKKSEENSRWTLGE